MGLFKFKFTLIKIKCYFKFSFLVTLATFQLLTGHVWLVFSALPNMTTPVTACAEDISAAAEHFVGYALLRQLGDLKKKGVETRSYSQRNEYMLKKMKH